MAFPQEQSRENDNFNLISAQAQISMNQVEKGQCTESPLMQEKMLSKEGNDMGISRL